MKISRIIFQFLWGNFFFNLKIHKIYTKTSCIKLSEPKRTNPYLSQDHTFLHNLERIQAMKFHNFGKL